VATLTRDSVSTTADGELADAALAASGDVQAFERLYRAHLARMHSLARRMLGDEGDANEATQDIFVRAWEKLATFRGESAFGTWLHRLGINLLLGRRAQRARRLDRHLAVDDAVAQLRSARATPELRVDFEGAIARLPAGAREVFVLHDVEGFKHHEIAEMLGVTSGTSKAQLHRARMALRRHLGGRGGQE
jgi:RNA polymerase sigma-70 factor (ECF subfamily)